MQRRFTQANLEALLNALGDIPAETALNIVKQKSRDFFWYSPILKEALEDRRGDVVVTPRNEADVIRVSELCARYGVPMTVRGAGTGNYGQAVPLQGGVILDMIMMNELGSVEGGIIHVGPGAKLKDIDDHARSQGWELRMFPSTIRTATIGGFIAGGSAGVGSINFGLLRQRGTILSLCIVTLEEKPRTLELRGDAINQVQHAYGTNGIITRVELALAPAQNWIDVGVTFSDFMQLARFCREVAASDGIAKKLVTAIAAPTPSRLRTFPVSIPQDASLGIMMVAPASLDPFLHLLAAFGGQLIYRNDDGRAEDGRAVPLYEFTWNHTTLQILKVDRNVTYLQSAFPTPDALEIIDGLCAELGDEMSMHLEFMRVDGRVSCGSLPLLRFTTTERLREIIKIFQARGGVIANPHTFVLDDGGRKPDDLQGSFKANTDPLGLLNPGKTYVAPVGGGMKSSAPSALMPANN